MSKPEAIEIDARSLADGVSKACATLGVSPKDIDVQVLEKHPEAEDPGKRYRLRIVPRVPAAAPAAVEEASSEEDSRDGSWIIVSREDGIYLVVNPPTGKGHACSVEGVIRGLAEAKVRGVEASAVEETVQAHSSQPTRIAPAEPLPI